ncbi:MAG: hypothetical protein GC165_01080 [Armatimonadetes bacterium]|nr:hypothetical protein [Armatimonadota bacterium]
MHRKTIRLEMMADRYDLPLSTRAINLMFKLGILTAEALITADLEAISNIDGVGPNTIGELRQSQEILRKELSR